MRIVARPLELEELVEHFTLGPGELELLRGKAGATRLGFALMLRFLVWRGRFPHRRGELLEALVTSAGDDGAEAVGNRTIGICWA
jgi:hypothetical protein